MRWLILVGAFAGAGCDVVFGLGDPSLPSCVPRAGFDGALPQAVRPDTEIVTFSLTSDERFAVFDIGGLTMQATGDEPPRPISIDPAYTMVRMGLDPEGEYLLFTAAYEPFPVLSARPIGGDIWELGAKAPKGSIAGTPSDAKSGKPVRVVVRLEMVPNVFQEYERTADGDWVPVNDEFTLATIGGANLSPDGMVITYDGEEDGVRGVYVTERASFDETFRRGTLIFAGVHEQPQLVGDCSVLYTIDDGTGERVLTKYVR